MTLRAAFAFLFALASFVQSASAQTFVLDGTTLDVDGTRWRLADIHAPGASEAGGAAAKAALQDLTRRGSASCRMLAIDRAKRRVGWCAVDGEDLGEALVRSGVAARCPGADVAGRYEAAQAAAGPWPHALPRWCGASRQ